MRRRNQLDRVELMLTALLEGEKLIEWVGGYVFGNTSKNDDPYIMLYPLADGLKERTCRVYPHKFKELEGLIPVDFANIPADVVSRSAPDKDEAMRRGIYHLIERPFQVLLKYGKDTSQGREKRFTAVLKVMSKPVETAVPPAPAPSAPPKVKTIEQWLSEAYEADDDLTLDHAVSRAIAFYQKDSSAVHKFRECLFGEFPKKRPSPEYVRLTVEGLRAYASHRGKNKDHETAKSLVQTSFSAKLAKEET